MWQIVLVLQMLLWAYPEAEPSAITPDQYLRAVATELLTWFH